MAESLAKQRESIRRQADALSRNPPAQGVAPDPFFTVSWPKPVSMLNAECDPLPKAQVDALIEGAASKEGVEGALIRRVMERESAFRPCAVSVKGAQGLMQLMPATAEQFGVRDPFDPAQNVAAGAKFLKQLLAKYGGDPSLTLAAYNAGPGAVDRAGGVPDIPETKAYVGEILKKLIF